MTQVVDISTDNGYARPRDPVELWLARCWQEVLGFGVGIRENFFGIGGNSLDAARVVNAVLDELHVQLPLNVVTEHPTVERLAARLRDEDTSALAVPLQEIQSGDGTRPPLFMVHPDDGEAGPYCHLARALGEEFAVFGLQAVGLYTDAEPLGTVAAMARAYVEEIRTVEPAGPYLLGGCATGAAVAYEMACQLVDAGAEVRLLAAVDTELVEPHADRPPRDETPEFVARSSRVSRANRDATRAWRPRPYPGPLDLFGEPAGTRPPAVDWSVAGDRRVHECGAAADGTHVRELARVLRELIG